MLATTSQNQRSAEKSAATRLQRASQKNCRSQRMPGIAGGLADAPERDDLKGKDSREEDRRRDLHAAR